MRRSLLIFFLFLTSFGIRLYHISKPPMDFAEVRQYQLAHIARGYYFEHLDSIPEWRKQIAGLNMQRMGFLLEPRIMEHAAVFGYRVAGAEYLWIPRVLSSVFWLIGGVFLYQIAKKIFTAEEALLSTAFYLFLPFGILASRSFQPDPLMTMMLIGGVFMILRFFERTSLSRLFTAAIFSSCAILVKPYSLFLIFGAFFSVSISMQGVKKSLFNRNTAAFVFLCLLPAVVYYASIFFSSAGFVKEHAGASFLPQLLLHSYFWAGWLAMIGLVVGYIALAGAFIGLFLIREKLQKALLIGLWIGYFIYGLSATYQIHTHDYYHIPIIPIVALSIGPIGASLINRLFILFSSWKRISISVIIFLVIFLYLGFGIKKIQLRDYKENIKLIGATIGVYPKFHKFFDNFEKEVRISKEIGEIVGHSANTVFLTSDYGRSLSYHGELSGLPWPNRVSLQERRERELKIPQKEELFNLRYLTIRTHGKYIRYTPDFFIITDLKEFEDQKDLRYFISKNFSLMVRNDDYLIFDMRKTSDAD